LKCPLLYKPAAQRELNHIDCAEAERIKRASGDRRSMIEDMAELHTSEADRRELHTLVDQIPAGDLPAARKILRALADPVWQSILAAPLDDEPETEEERAEVEAARSESGSGTSHDDVLREFGL
jgi:hypothetical protein